MTYSIIQKEILRKLLTKYESSKTYQEENTLRQSFYILPREVFVEYESDFTNIDKIFDFENQVSMLAKDSLVEIIKDHQRFKKIKAVSTEQNWNKIRNILGVKEKRVIQQEELLFYKAHLDEHEIIKQYCSAQIERIISNKKPQYSMDEAKQIITLLAFILNNKSEILERELSISVLHNSKTWEQKYKERVCRILRNSSYFKYLVDSIEDVKEANSIILEELNIYSNPSYIYFKGNAEITLETNHEIAVIPDFPFALSSESIGKIKKIEVFDKSVMTIENLTTFNRLKKENTFIIYLSGYHNTMKQKFLIKLYEQNISKGLSYYHFGDIDPDGFLILENLRKKTNIDFIPYHMNIADIINYEEYTKPLEQNDLIKAQGLLEGNLYSDIIHYMLNKNEKLEQEIISWLEKNL